MIILVAVRVMKEDKKMIYVAGTMIQTRGDDCVSAEIIERTKKGKKFYCTVRASMYRLRARASCRERTS